MPPELLEFAQIESAVRQGQEPDNPALLGTYLAMAGRLASQHKHRCEQRKIHFRVACTLLDTICDTYVPKHWRCLCLDNIYQPINTIEKLAISDAEKWRVTRFRYELNTLGDYFL